jgi:hypothetical protein
MTLASLKAGAIPHVRIHHPAPPPRAAPRPRNGAHHDPAYSRNGLLPRYEGDQAVRDLLFDERLDVVLVADQVCPVSAPSLRRPGLHAHVAQDAFLLLHLSMSFGAQNRTKWGYHLVRIHWSSVHAALTRLQAEHPRHLHQRRIRRRLLIFSHDRAGVSASRSKSSRRH